MAPRLLPVILAGVTYDPRPTPSPSAPPSRSRPGCSTSSPSALTPSATPPGGCWTRSGAGQEGTPLVVTFAQGRKLHYVDHDGDTVQLMLKGHGVLQLVRRTDGEGERLTLGGTTPITKLMGLVQVEECGRQPHDPRRNRRPGRGDKPALAHDV